MCNKAQATNIVNAEKTPKHNPVFFLIFFTSESSTSIPRTYVLRIHFSFQIGGAKIVLTHLFLMHTFSTPWKHQENQKIVNRKGALGTNGLAPQKLLPQKWQYFFI